MSWPLKSPLPASDIQMLGSEKVFKDFVL